MADMEFWGVEVKAGQPVKSNPALDHKYLHLSQASLGEVKKDKGSEPIHIYVKIGDQKLVLATLSPEKCTHISFDLVFEREFELSHNWKHGSVYFCGYTTIVEEEPEEGFTDTDSDLEGDQSLLAIGNGKSEVKDEQPNPTANKANANKPESSAAKPKVQIVEPKKAKDDESDDDDESDEESDEEDSDDEDMVEAGGDSDDDEDSDDENSEEDKATWKKAEISKKRTVESATKTPLPDKKAKLITPSDQASGKKGVHTATPYPLKKAGKTPANDNKSKPQTPKSGGQVTCKSCSKTFNSEIALQSHTKAKHSTGK